MRESASALVAAVILLAATFGCAASSSQTGPRRLTLPDNSLSARETGERWENKVREELPVGVPVADAKRLLEAEGFVVTNEVDREYDSYFTAKYVRRAGLLVSRGYIAIVHFDEGRVTKVEGDVEVYGP